MDSMEQYGFDANFIGDFPAYFKCVVCHLVLRQPVQIMSCGHHFCKACFDRIHGYSKYLNTVFCCPIDREVVDMNKVFEDMAVAREIGNLQMTCSSSSQGCSWQGDLRCLQDHEKDCQYKLKIPDEQRPVCKEDVLMKDLLQRVQSCEESLLEKDKDIGHLKFNLDEMKSLYDRKEKEFDSIKTFAIEMQNEIKVMKRSNEEIKSHFEKEIIELKNENKRLEAQVVENKNGLMEGEVIEIVEKQMQEMQINLTNKLSCHKENVHSKIEKSLEPVKDELSKMGNEVQKLSNEVRSIRSHTDKTLNKKSDELNNLTTRLETSENLLLKDYVKEVATHVNNIENILFRYLPYVENELKFKWVLTDYYYHFETGEDVESPMFYPQYKGYCFKLMAEWSGENKENIGFFLRLCRGRDIDVDLEPFNVIYELAVLRKNGTYETRQVNLEYLDEFKDDCFTILPGQQEAEEGFGFPNMLTKSEVKDHVINDTMYITCTFKLN